MDVSAFDPKFKLQITNVETNENSEQKMQQKNISIIGTIPSD